MVPITVGVASPKGSLAYDSLSRTLLASRGVYAVVGVTSETGDIDANRGVGLVVGIVLDRADAAWIRRLRQAGDVTPVLAICRPAAGRFAVAAGADGVLGFDEDRLDLERAIAACARGGTWIPAELEESRLEDGSLAGELEAEAGEIAEIVALARNRASA